MVEHDSDELSISRQAELLSLNRTSLYYTPVAVSDEEIRLRRRIDEIYTDRPASGSRYITAILRREGWPHQPQACSALYEGHGDCWRQSWSKPEQTQLSSQNLPLSVGRGKGEPSEPCLVCGYHLYPSQTRMDVLGSCD